MHGWVRNRIVVVVVVVVDEVVTCTVDDCVPVRMVVVASDGCLCWVVVVLPFSFGWSRV